MPAHEMQHSEHRLIRKLQKLGQGVKPNQSRHAPGPRVSARKQRDQKQQSGCGIKLYEAVGTQISYSSQLGPAPKPEAGYAGQEQRRQQNQSQLDADAVNYKGGNQRGEYHRHGQAIPEQADIAGGQMVVSRANGRERHSGKYDHIGQPLAVVLKTGRRPPAIQYIRKSHGAHDGEREVRQDVPGVGNPPEGALIGKVVIRGILRPARQAPRDRDQNQGDNHKQPKPAVAGHICLPCREDE